jgi:hypothetical protein
MTNAIAIAAKMVFVLLKCGSAAERYCHTCEQEQQQSEQVK